MIPLTETVISFEQVTKRFGDLTAVDDLSFAVPAGGIFGFLGGNGAGKTTSLRMALDILVPSSGRIAVMGAAPSRENAATIGFLPEERGLYRRMTVLDTIVYFGRLKRMEAGAARKAAMQLLERLDLADRAKTPVLKLSKGLAQKVQVATALVNAPRLLLLDEPFSGLDPVNQSVLEELIAEAAGEGATVVFSTHVMQHAERLCDRLLLLARGRKAFEGTQADARQALPSRLALTSRSDPGTLPGVANARELGPVEDGWRSFEVKLDHGIEPGALLEHCTTSGFPLRAFDVHTPTLHEVFIHFVGADRETAS
jgi:ABC-2 type transport system ATP-binding protein